jgi:hypothetical protein
MIIPTTTTATKSTLLNLFYIPSIPFLAYLSVPVESIFILTILLGFDYVTGVIKVFTLKGHLKSYRAIAGLLTKASILLLVLAIAFMAKGIGMDFTLYLQLLISMLIISETYSIIGNVYCIKTKEEIEEIDAVAMVIKKVRYMIEKFFIINRDNS